MAYAAISYTGLAGSTTDFAFSFSYLSSDDISVTVEGVTTSFTLPSTNVVRVSPAPSGTLTITRNTPITTKVTTFVDGSVQTAALHNDQNNQLLYTVQEAKDDAAQSLKHNLVTFDCGGKRLENVADPTGAQDAATKNWVDSQVSALNPDTVTAAAATATEQAAIATAAAADAAASAASASPGASVGLVLALGG